MQLVKQVFVIFIIAIIPLTGAYGDTVAVFLNIPCNTTVQSEFDQWESSPEIRQIFTTIIRLNGSTPDNFPTRDSIVKSIQKIHEQKPVSVFYFIYGTLHKNETLIDFNRKEIKEELFVVNDKYVAPNIVIIDINRSFNQYQYVFPKSDRSNIYRTSLESEFDLSDIRQKLIAHNKPITSEFLINKCNLSLTPLTNTTGPFISGPVSNDTQSYFMTHTEQDTTNFQNKFYIFEIFSKDDFKTCDHIENPYPAINVLSLYFHSPYYYAFSEQNGNKFEIYKRATRQQIFSRPITAQPTQDDLNSLSIEYTFPNITAMAFVLPNHRLGLFKVQNNYASFKEIDCGNQNIECMTFGTVGFNECLVYIHNKALKYRILQNKMEPTITDDETVFTNNKLSNMYGAKLIWRLPNAMILAKEKGFFWNENTNQLTELYNHNNIDVHFVDTFVSGSGDLFGFVWSGTQMIEGKSRFYVKIGIENDKKTDVQMFDITPYIQAVMTSPKASQMVTPALYLIDNSRWCTKLTGALVYNSDKNKTVLKHVEICLRKSCLSKNPIKVLQTNKDIPATNLKLQIRVLDPTGKKLVVRFAMKNNKPTGQQLFSFSKVRSVNRR